MGLKPEDFSKRLSGSASLNRVLGPLNVKGGTVQRQVFQQTFADIVREFLPDAQITFEKDGGRDESGNYLVDNSRLCKEFGIEYPPLRTRVLEIINDVRREAGLPLIARR